MARANEAVAALLQEYADLLSITGTPEFRVRVYEKAARAVSGHHADVSTLDLQQLQQIPGVGKSIADKVAEFIAHGRVDAVEKLQGEDPRGVRALTAIPGLGPKKAMHLHTELGIASLADLERAIDDGELAELRGFGAGAPCGS